MNVQWTNEQMNNYNGKRGKHEQATNNVSYKFMLQKSKNLSQKYVTLFV